MFDPRGGRYENPLTTWLYTTLFCIAIAGLLYTVGVDATFWPSLIISLSIGWSICGAYTIFARLVFAYMSDTAGAILLTGGGLVAGLLIAGGIVFGEALHFFTDNQLTLVIGIFFGAVGYTVFGTRARLAAAEAGLARAAAEAERQARVVTETELKLLQAQVEPHFLFNTLSNIASLIRTDPANAEATLLNLTTFLRASLGRTRQESTTLNQEFELIRSYLDIHATRMQGRLSHDVSLDAGLESISLPPMLVQPLVENAIRHGIDPLEQGGQIAVTAAMRDGDLIIEVCDTGAGPDSRHATHGTGTGLRNVRERLRALYGDDAELTLSPNEPAGWVSRITITAAALATARTNGSVGE